MTLTPQNSKSDFASLKQSIVIRPKSNNLQGFIYHDFSDLKNLVRFVGTKPQIDEEGNLYFRKTMIPDNSVVLRDAYGRVEKVMSFEQADKDYEIVGQSDFKPEHANVVIAKEKSTNGNKGMTREELKVALTKAKIDFKSGLTRDQLQGIYDANKK